MKLKILICFSLILVIMTAGCARKKFSDLRPPIHIIPRNVIYAGVRSSSYGIDPFPAPKGWRLAMQTMSGYFEGSAPCAIWIVGEFRRNKACHLYFPSDSNEYVNIEFEEVDKHEPYLDHFDQAGIQVFLQVEPASADMLDLIDLVLNRYKHHECVIGFGVDVEWYRESENPEWGVKVDDETARLWETRVKSHNSQYQLFLKHWDRDWMPPTYRGDIVFVDDSQMLEDFDAMLEEFVAYWSDYFKPNTVFFQIGYRPDKSWWRKLTIPPAEIGKAIASRIEQNCGVFWVDFTLREVLPTDEE
ncbi:MAG: hypothetical protein ACETWK_12720 [Candidatus Aminicenantaceae bacterium]